MIRYLVDLALNNRILVLSVALVLFIWGILSFHNLPIEAYPESRIPTFRSFRSGPGTPPRKWNNRLQFPVKCN
jgi:cobalt-zinc-cadmium resistance protein CzcA